MKITLLTLVLSVSLVSVIDAGASETVKAKQPPVVNKIGRAHG